MRADRGADPRDAAGTAAVFRAERWRIGLTYGVTLLENLFYLLYPWTIGLAIDGLLAGNGLRSLVPLVVIWGLHILVGAARQVYDTWVFARIHAQIATGTIARQRTAGVGTTEIAARSVMSRELVDFFEREVPTIVTAGLGLVGGMAMLLWYDHGEPDRRPAAGPGADRIHRHGAPRPPSKQGSQRRGGARGGPDRAGRPGPLASHFRRRGRLRVRLSNAEAGSWSWSSCSRSPRWCWCCCA